MRKTTSRQNQPELKAGFSLLNLKQVVLLLEIGLMAAMLSGCSPITSSDQNGTGVPANSSSPSSTVNSSSTTNPNNPTLKPATTPQGKSPVSRQWE